MADFNISAVITGDGVTSPVLPLLVPEGSDLLVNFTPDLGWQVESVHIDGSPMGAVTSFQFTDIFSDFEIELVFSEVAGVTYPIVVQDNAFGIISPGGTVVVPTGDDQLFSVVASKGYEHTNWIIDGVDEPATPTYTFVGVVAPHTIGAKFTKIIAYRPSVKLLKEEEITVKRRDFDRGHYDKAGYRNQGPLYQTFKILANKQPGQTQSGMLQAVGSQVDQRHDYDHINTSWKVFTFEAIFEKDILVLNGEDYEVLDVDDWTSYNLRAVNFRVMARKIKSRREP